MFPALESRPLTTGPQEKSSPRILRGKLLRLLKSDFKSFLIFCVFLFHFLYNFLLIFFLFYFLNSFLSLVALLLNFFYNFGYNFNFQDSFLKHLRLLAVFEKKIFIPSINCFFACPPCPYIFSYSHSSHFLNDW